MRIGGGGSSLGTKHPLSRSLSCPLSLSFFLPLSVLSLSVSPSLGRTLSVLLSLPLCLFFSFSLTLFPSLPLSGSLCHSHTVSLSHTPTLYLCLSPRSLSRVILPLSFRVSVSRWHMRARLISLSSLVFLFSRSLVLALSLVRAHECTLCFPSFCLFPDFSLPVLLYLLLYFFLSHICSNVCWVEHRCHSCSHLIAPASVDLSVSLSVSQSLSFLIPFSVSALSPAAGVLALDFFLSLLSLFRDLLFSFSVFPVFLKSPFLSFSLSFSLSLYISVDCR